MARNSKLHHMFLSLGYLFCLIPSHFGGLCPLPKVCFERDNKGLLNPCLPMCF